MFLWIISPQCLLSGGVCSLRGVQEKSRGYMNTTSMSEYFLSSNDGKFIAYKQFLSNSQTKLFKQMYCSGTKYCV